MPITQKMLIRNGSGRLAADAVTLFLYNLLSGRESLTSHSPILLTFQRAIILFDAECYRIGNLAVRPHMIDLPKAETSGAGGSGEQVTKAGRLWRNILSFSAEKSKLPKDRPYN